MKINIPPCHHHLDCTPSASFPLTTPSLTLPLHFPRPSYKPRLTLRRRTLVSAAVGKKKKQSPLPPAFLAFGGSVAAGDEFWGRGLGWVGGVTIAIFSDGILRALRGADLFLVLVRRVGLREGEGELCWGGGGGGG